MRPLCADWMEAGVLCALKRLCRQRVEVGHDSTAKWLVSGTLDEAAMSFNPPCRKRAAAGRVCHGAVLEAFAAERAAALYPIDRVELPPDAADQRLVCQLYFDAYAAAVWTSAHAEFIAALDEGLVEPQSPTIGTFPCASSAFDVSNLFIRRSMPKGEAYPKCSEALVQLLSRCTNPGSRGWDSVLKESLDNVGSRSIVQHAIVVCLTGMHPQIHPANRPSWKVRMRILRIADNRLSNLEHVVKAAMYIKEAVRRLLASTMVSVSAMHASLGNLGHPVRHFHQPPVQFPHIGMEAAMTAFVEAGTSMVTTTTAMGMTDTPNLPEALDRAFRARSEGFTPETGGVKWANSWLGKGTANIHNRQPLVALASEVWTAAFKAHFIPFWLFAQTHQLRVYRLDSTQHAAIHTMNAATRLVSNLPEAELLAVQRKALDNPSAGILTISEVAEEIGIDGKISMPPNGCTRSALDGACMLGDAGPIEAARLLAYARTAWLSEEVLIYDLGEKTKRLQTAALRKRLKLTDDMPLPVHATHLCCCTECQRVANAHATTESCVAFNELGISSCQISTDAPVGQVHLHCAKRSSAALRTAIAFESDMSKHCVEELSVDPEDIARLTTERSSSGMDSGIAARVRRDAKNALEQRSSAVGCGENKMVTIPILGRAIRIYKQWFALCSYCAAFVRIKCHFHRYGVELCCMRCDVSLIDPELQSQQLVKPQNLQKICRFCGAVDPERQGLRWKEIKSPLDVAGPNATIPPPLRRVFYCPAHTRQWLVSAHRVLETRQILAHLAHNARPIFGVNTDDKPVAHAPNKAPKSKGVRKRKRRVPTCKK